MKELARICSLHWPKSSQRNKDLSEVLLANSAQCVRVKDLGMVKLFQLVYGSSVPGLSKNFQLLLQLPQKIELYFKIGRN
jgi:hypothetical protein